MQPPPDGPPRFLCAGALTERKNVVRLADAFAALGEGTLTYAGDGPLRPQLEGRPGVRLLGRVPHDEIPALLADSHVLCQPSLLEPLGQALLEGMACGRSVVATRLGGPPEFVPPAAGILVDPLDVEAMTEALRATAAFPRPNDAAREAAASHDVRRQAERIEELLSLAPRRQIREPDLDERPHLVLETGLPRHLERLLPALARLLRVDTLLQPVVAGDEQLLDLRPRPVVRHETGYLR